MKTFQKILWGIVLIAVGVILVLRAFDIVDFDIFFKGWWTLLIIVPSFIGLFNLDDRSEKLGNLFMIILGVLLLLASQGVIEFEILWKVLLPVVLVLVGMGIICSSLFGRSTKKKINQLNKNGEKECRKYVTVFSGQKEKIAKEKFDGCDMTVVFGGMELDLTNAVVERDIVINASALFGGASIVVPKNANVEHRSNSFFGGVDNRANNGDGKGPRIYVNASCFCGGIEIVDETTKKKHRH